MKQKGKLKENKKTENIFIDLTKQEREIQKKLRTIAKEEKRKRKERKVGYRKITGTVEMKRRKGTRGFSVGWGICDAENGHNGNGKKIKKNVNGQTKWDLKKKHKGNTREKIRRGRQKQKRNEEGKSERNI
jgi:hypothetical protein